MTALVEGAAQGWQPVCRLSQVPVDGAVAALVDGHQVALVRTSGDGLFALGNRDPVSGAMVLARGLVGSRGDVPVLISPMHKQAFALTTGVCVDDGAVAVPVYPVRLDGEVVHVRVDG